MLDFVFNKIYEYKAEKICKIKEEINRYKKYIKTLNNCDDIKIYSVNYFKSESKEELEINDDYIQEFKELIIFNFANKIEKLNKNLKKYLKEE